ncbi:hypothetical protein M413DRAFT_238919 [Hebeloma cylindrosporum]|uniref:SET domain-containing protein n=1 Tax=Hebeloma cylindrosporum TaxID=76867 RepID=A0A0C3BQE6_HEBCY|nr:hypothetical protein M413DRAFT_238919 [Hebeloma cylindrosporum h7]
MRRGFLNSKKVKAVPLYPEPAEKIPVIPKGLQGEEHYRTDPHDGRRNIKIPYGSSGKENLPEKYKGPQTVYKALHTDLEHETDSTNIVYTTLPEQFIGVPEHSDGHTQCMLMGATKAQIVGSRRYLTQPIPKVASAIVVIKNASEGAGLGMFAERDIKFGERILAERPLLMHPAVYLYTPGAAGVDEYTFEQHMAIMRHETEIGLEFALRRMSDENQAVYKALSNAHKEDGSGPLFGIFRTNALGIDIDELTDTTSAPNVPRIYSIIVKDGSRINHSCTPNVCQKFSMASFSNQIFAIRDIKAGEEILYPYCDPFLPVADRREKLAPYGFTCTCRACSAATPESDKFRQTCKENIARYQRIYDVALGLRQGNDDIRKKVLGPAAAMRDRMMEEGLGGMYEEFVDVTVLLHKAYTKLAVQEEAKGLQRFLKFWALLQGA